MLVCDLSLPTPAGNLALDEALMEQCESSGLEVLRFWESPQHFVVVGYANRVESEVNLTFCRAAEIPVLRRCTGGGTVIQGPGCLNYSLVMQIKGPGPLSTITGTNSFVLGRHSDALTPLLKRPVRREGDTDLAVGGIKFSGNAQRRGRAALLFHGTLLLGLDLKWIGKALPMPSRQPTYRNNRPHGAFVANLGVDRESVKAALTAAWSAAGALKKVPIGRAEELAKEKYDRHEWNFKF